MKSTSVRTFSRDPDLRQRIVNNKQGILIKSREKNGVQLRFLLIPLASQTSDKLKAPQESDFQEFMGAFGRDRLNLRQAKTEQREVWEQLDE